MKFRAALLNESTMEMRGLVREGGSERKLFGIKWIQSNNVLWQLEGVVGDRDLILRSNKSLPPNE